MNSESRKISVYADWFGLIQPTLMGWLFAEPIRGKEVFSFEFTPEWLESGLAFYLDPNLRNYAGRQYSGGKRNVFGVFLDSSPDRWGRRLIMRREAIRSRKENRAVRRLSESDYLLGLHDFTRMGALRFKLDETGDFLCNDSGQPAPPWVSLRELEAASLHYEEEDFGRGEHEKWLNMLIAPGSSLGGARPKANVTDESGDLWIAKFPSHSDSYDVGAWEMLCHRLACLCGIRVPECKLEAFSRQGSTFLSRRFDRQEGRRIHFASAMTLLGRSDGDNYESGCSYLDIAQFISRQGAEPVKDLEELWKRIVFHIAVSNTDDHLRNHGFILTSQGWILSPAYDINPNPLGAGLSLNISEQDNTLDYGLVISVAPLFRLNIEQAENMCESIKNTVNRWRNIASQLGISNRQIDMLAPAFRC